MFGDAINLAARLMGVASRGEHAVLCDSRTREMAQDAAGFVALEPMLVKVGSYTIRYQLPRHSKAEWRVPNKSDAHAVIP
jgi:class 3 adenylate cyclase